MAGILVPSPPLQTKEAQAIKTQSALFTLHHCAILEFVRPQSLSTPQSTFSSRELLLLSTLKQRRMCGYCKAARVLHPLPWSRLWWSYTLGWMEQ
ncbi:hypothetical protein PC123_g4083 [Phytophthora cactorum]|nr:hypothetical protein PC122_g14332 [Phytophthora cactorum]KAG4061029.1 hypothetical protein PC123_g4083 [Phytophthora cactorum]